MRTIQVTAARTFAIQAHGNQRYGDAPYHVHLDAVVELLEPYGPVAQTIGYLHDVVEDTKVTKDDIEAMFDGFVADAVDILTDEPGANRAERKARTYKKMSEVEGDLCLALLVKTADRLANVKACVEMGRNDKLAMYKDEHKSFRTAVYRPGLCEELWEELNSLLAGSDL